jgi:hypothetical protein
MKIIFTILVSIFVESCTTLDSSSATSLQSDSPPIVSSKNLIPFKYLDDSIIVVPIKINESITRDFILDTGIGISMISKSLCDQFNCQIVGSHTGKRMSGQVLTVPTSSVKSLALGSLQKINVSVGIIDIDKFIPGSNIGGFLSLGFFRDTPFTIDYGTKNIVLETKDSIKAIKVVGETVPVKLDVDGEAVGVFIPLLLPNGEQIVAEVDTGSQALILHERFMASLGFIPNDKRVRSRDGKDETGNIFKRYFTKISGRVQLPRAHKIGVDSIDVMFQKIIYDGLVGHYFLSQFQVTYDLPKSEMIFRIPQVSSGSGGVNARN